MEYYSISEVPSYFQVILRRIEEMFSSSLLVEDYDDEWVHFHVSRYVDRSAITVIQNRNSEILYSDEQADFQILCPWSSQGGTGLWLHYLEDEIAQVEYKCGVWYY